MGAVEASVLILVAVIGAAATFLATWNSNRKTRRKNDEQHLAGQALLGEGAALLTHLAGQVEGIDGKIDGLADDISHIKDWQLKHTSEAHDRDTAIAELQHQVPPPAAKLTVVNQIRE